MAAQRTQANVKVDGFAVSSGEGTTRLEFPRAELAELRGRAGGVEYVASGLTFDALEGRFGPLHWTCTAGSVGGLVVREPDGRYELAVGHIELPRGVQLTRAAGGGVELVAPEATLSDVRLHLPELRALRGGAGAGEAASRTAATGAATAVGGERAAGREVASERTRGATLRQERLQFLDAVRGSLAFRLKVALDLPVVGKRTLDQVVKIVIEDGSFDYRTLDDHLDWLEGAFLDVGVSDGRFKVGWSVPLMASREIISWALAPRALEQARRNRIPLRVLADARVGGRTGAPPAEGNGKRRLRSMTIADIDVRLSMAAPRSVEVGGGAILFGGDDAPGIVDLRVEGALIHPPAAGGMMGRIGGLDLTLKDVRAGGVMATVDRLHIDGIEELLVDFDGFTPTSLGVTMKRVTAMNLVLVLS